MTPHNEAAVTTDGTGLIAEDGWWNRSGKAEKAAVAASLAVGSFLTVGLVNTVITTDPTAPTEDPGAPAAGAGERGVARPAAKAKGKAGAPATSARERKARERTAAAMAVPREKRATPAAAAVPVRKRTAPAAAAAAPSTSNFVASPPERVAPVPNHTTLPAAKAKAEAAPAAAKATNAKLEACNTAVAAGGAGRIDCISSSNGVQLQIVSGNTPLLLKGLEARMISTSVEGNRGRIRLRVRNTEARTRLLNVQGKQVYLNIGGRRFFSDEQVLLKSKEATFVVLGFELPNAKVSAADLAILPFGKRLTEKPQDMGIMRIRFKRA